MNRFATSGGQQVSQKRTHVLSLVRQMPVGSRHDFCFSLNALACQFAVFRDRKKCSNGPQVSLEVKLKTIDAIIQTEGLVATTVRFVEVLRSIWNVKSVSMPLKDGHSRWKTLVYP